MSKIFSKKWHKSIREETRGNFGFCDRKWTPLLTPVIPGIDITVEHTAGNGLDETFTISVDKHTLTLAHNETVPSGSSAVAFITDMILPSPNTNGTHYGISFKLDAPGQLAKGGYFCFIAATILDPVNAGDIFTGVELYADPADANRYQIIMIGNYNTTDFAEPTINVPWSSNAEYLVSFNPLAGTHGTLYFWSSINSNPLLPVHSYALTEAASAPTAFDFNLIAGPGGGNPTFGNETIICTVVNTPTYIPPGVTLLSPAGGEFNPASYPSDKANRALEITGVSAPVELNNNITVDNGDVIIFNISGDLIAKL